MNPDNCLPFSLSSPSHSPDLHSSQNHHFSLGLVNEAMESHFHNQEWNLIHTHGGGGSGGDHIPKVADFLGVCNKSDSDLVLYNGIQPNETNYLFQTNNLMSAPVQNSLGVMRNDCYDLQENANNLQALTLSMGSGKGSSSSCDTARLPVDNSNTNNAIVEANPKRNLDTFGQRTSIYRGVTRHRWTGRYEAHLWDNSCRREGQTRKGRQVYLGGYDKEDKAARSYDLAALKYWGTSTTTNFPISNYEKEIEEMKQMTRQEFVASIRRKSSGFSRGASMYRGVTRHHQHGRWQARIGRVAGNKDLYLGTFGTEEEAAEAYDVAAIKFRGLNAVTNFDMNRYDVKSILESNTLPIGGGAAKRLKEAQALESSLKREEILGLQSAAGPTNFHYVGSNMNVPIQAYPLNVHHHSFDQNQTLLALQNHQDMTNHFSSPQDSHNYQTYIQTQLQLQHEQQQQQQQSASSYHSNLYDVNYLHGTHGMLGDHETDSSGGSYGYLGNELGIGLGSGAGAGSSGGNTNVGPAHEQGLGLAKVDYDVRPGSSTYGGTGWSNEEPGQGSGAGFFSMWNDG